MILDQAQIEKIIKENPNKALIDKGKQLNKTLRMHMYGEKIEAELTTIDGYEKESLHQLRLKYARSNRDIVSRTCRPLDKIFSARGGSVYFNLDETNEKKARQLASDIKGGMSIKKWMQSFWRQHYLDDPCGLIFNEIASEQEAVKLWSKGKSIVYPTYKSIQAIYDYQPNGDNLEYVVFYVSASEKLKNKFKIEDKIYRVVDDAQDYWVKHEGENVMILDEYTMPNLFMHVPAITNSDIADPNYEGSHLSIFTDVFDLLNEYLTKGSIKLTHEFLFAFPKYWEYADDCTECKGMKIVDGKFCKTCKGSGKNIMSKVSDSKVLRFPRDKEDVVVAPNIAGFVEPSKTYYDISTHSMSLLEDIIYFTIWGTGSQHKASGTATTADGPDKTATEATMEIKPQADRLTGISECGEKREKFILDAMIMVNLRLPNYTGSSVNYGKRYMIEGPDVLWKKYIEARKSGSSYSVLDDHLTEYYEAKFSGDPVRLAIQIKMMKVEPFIHNTVDEIKEWPVNPIDKYIKSYYGEWVSLKKDSELIVYPVEKLRKDLVDYAATKSGEVSDSSTPLAIKMGTAGIQSLQLILSDSAMDEESKKQALIILFGIPEADAEKLVISDPEKKKELPAPVV